MSSQDTGPARYGRLYWCVKVSELSPSGEIYVTADSVEITPTGDLLFMGHAANDSNEKFPVLSIANGNWSAFFAASCLDGSAIAVDHWEGEVSR